MTSDGTEQSTREEVWILNTKYPWAFNLDKKLEIIQNYVDDYLDRKGY